MSKATGPVYNVPFKRRRKNVTNYAKRLTLLKSGSPRFVVRKSNSGVVVQVISFEGSDRTEVSASAKELEKYGWIVEGNLPTAYLTGFLCASKALKKGIRKAVLDIGLMSPNKASLPFAALKGAVDAGMEIPHSEGIFDDARFSGKHIAEYAIKLKETNSYNRLFSRYIKKGILPEEIIELFQTVKAKLEQL
ncbi:MAG: 50S ribosomal protein L18 [Candidatus Micrarchaeia archaeon]